MCRCTYRINDNLPFECEKVCLWNGDHFVGVLVAARGCRLFYQVDEPCMQRTVLRCEIVEIKRVVLPRPKGMSLVSTQAGMIGKHERATYLDAKDGCEQCTMRVLCAPEKRALVRAEIQSRLQIAVNDDDKDRDDDDVICCIPVAIPVAKLDDFVDLMRTLGLEHQIDHANVELSQYSPEKKDRDTELFDVPIDATLDDMTNPNIVGPSWRSTVDKYWCKGEFPSPFEETRTYTWQQLAKMWYEMLCFAHGDYESERLLVDGVSSRTLALSEPFVSYLAERLTVEKSLVAGVKSIHTKKLTRSQPQVAPAQLHQMYAASNIVHRKAAACELLVQAPELVSAAKIVLMLYRMRGFYVRKTRSYRKTGATSRFKGSTREWRDPETKRLYEQTSNMRPSTIKALVTDLTGNYIQHTIPEYRGKYKERQSAGTPIYTALKKRRNTTHDSVRDAKRIRCAKDNTICGEVNDR